MVPRGSGESESHGLGRPDGGARREKGKTGLDKGSIKIIVTPSEHPLMVGLGVHEQDVILGRRGRLLKRKTPLLENLMYPLHPRRAFGMAWVGISHALGMKNYPHGKPPALLPSALEPDRNAHQEILINGPHAGRPRFHPKQPFFELEGDHSICSQGDCPPADLTVHLLGFHVNRGFHDYLGDLLIGALRSPVEKVNRGGPGVGPLSQGNDGHKERAPGAGDGKEKHGPEKKPGPKAVPSFPPGKRTSSPRSKNPGSHLRITSLLSEAPFCRESFSPWREGKGLTDASFCPPPRLQINGVLERGS